MSSPSPRTFIRATKTETMSGTISRGRLAERQERDKSDTPYDSVRLSFSGNKAKNRRRDVKVDDAIRATKKKRAFGYKRAGEKPAGSLRREPQTSRERVSRKSGVKTADSKRGFSRASAGHGESDSASNRINDIFFLRSPSTDLHELWKTLCRNEDRLVSTFEITRARAGESEEIGKGIFGRKYDNDRYEIDAMRSVRSRHIERSSSTRSGSSFSRVLEPPGEGKGQGPELESESISWHAVHLLVNFSPPRLASPPLFQSWIKAGTSSLQDCT